MDFKFMFIKVTILIIQLNCYHAQSTRLDLHTLPTPDPTKYTPQDCQSLNNYYNKWITYDNGVTCYRLPSYYYDDASTWHEARAFCMKYNATLASIHDSDINYLLAHRNQTSPSSTAFWIGMNSLIQRGVYKWSDGSAVDFTNFANKTSNGDPIPPNIMDQGRCVSMRSVSKTSPYIPSDTGKWFKDDCNANHYFFCKKRQGDTAPPTEAPPAPGNCPQGWTKYASEKCVKFQDYKLTYAQSVQKCKNSNSEILTIHSDEEQNFITAFTAGLSEAYIGISRKDYDEDWLWPDQTSTTYTNWGLQPSHSYYSNYKCAYLVTNSSQPGKWIQTPCTDFKATICQQAQSSTIKDQGNSFIDENCKISGFDNFTQYGNSCYALMDTSSLSFQDAENYCQSIHGSHLLSVVDPFEQAFIKYIIKAYGKSDNYWIGLQSKLSSNTNVSQIFEWTDDWPVYVTDWNKGEPLFPDLPQEECVYMSRDNGTWMTTTCDSNYAYICKTTTNKLPDLNKDKSGVCPQPPNTTDKSLLWVDLDRRNPYCYWFSVDRKGYSSSGLMSYSDASFHCRRRNGTLASMHSTHELMLMKTKLNATKTSSYYSYNTWIGLTKNYLGNYQWEDGTALDFTNWDPNEKIVQQTDDLNKDSDRQCVEVTPQVFWKQEACTDDRNYFVCEIKKVYNGQPTASPSSEPFTGTGGPNTGPGGQTTHSSIDVQHSRPKGLTSGAKAGIAFGVIGGVALILVIAFFAMRRYRPNSTIASLGNPLYRSNRGNRRNSHDTPVAWSREQE